MYEEKLFYYYEQEKTEENIFFKVVKVDAHVYAEFPNGLPLDILEIEEMKRIIDECEKMKKPEGVTSPKWDIIMYIQKMKKLLYENYNAEEDLKKLSKLTEQQLEIIQKIWKPRYNQKIKSNEQGNWLA